MYTRVESNLGRKGSAASAIQSSISKVCWADDWVKSSAVGMHKCIAWLPNQALSSYGFSLDVSLLLFSRLRKATPQPEANSHSRVAELPCMKACCMPQVTAFHWYQYREHPYLRWGIPTDKGQTQRVILQASVWCCSQYFSVSQQSLGTCGVERGCWWVSRKTSDSPGQRSVNLLWRPEPHSLQAGRWVGG